MGLENAIICYKCHDELNELGALLFSPPSNQITSISDCKKIHICIKCYYKVMSLLQIHPVIPKQGSVDNG